MLPRHASAGSPGTCALWVCGTTAQSALSRPWRPCAWPQLRWMAWQAEREASRPLPLAAHR
eukprot:14401344-Alexandrium_andersonii.AAC.1